MDLHARAGFAEVNREGRASEFFLVSTNEFISFEELMSAILIRLASIVLAISAVAPTCEAKSIFDARDPAQDKELRRHMISMERPVYPNSARRMRKIGHGVFWIKFDKAGRVKAVKIIESMKHADLDNSAVYACYRWRCRPGEVDQAIVPIVFHFGGSRSTVPREVH